MGKKQGEKKRRGKPELAGHLLILACSQTKRDTRVPLPAFHLYNGVNYRVLRKILLERGWPPGLQIKILSAKHGLIDATKRIMPYDRRMDKRRAQKANQKVLRELRDVPAPKTVFVNLGADYLPAVDGIKLLSRIQKSSSQTVPSA